MDGEDWRGLAVRTDASREMMVRVHGVVHLHPAPTLGYDHRSTGGTAMVMDIHNIFTRPSRHFHSCPVKLAGRQGSIGSKRGTTREPLRSV
jgi:hypothetical protein